MALQRYSVAIPDREYFQNQVNCRTACPVGTNAGGYVALIGEGRYAEAYAEARRPNPFASVCGRICAHPCEAACRRQYIDEPISIRALKRFVTERYGVEAPSPVNIRDLVEHPGPVAGTTGKRVAVIGAGPGGLACAHDLALHGHAVTVFESTRVAGGMLLLGIPEYRLPRDLLRQEIAFIEDLGVDIRLNTTVGKDVQFADLTRDHDAVFIGAGCMRGRTLGIEGNDLDGVLKAVDFLLNVNLGYNVELGKRVVIIGGGNVAFDAARSAARFGGTSEPEEPDHHVMIDTARMARRSGAHQVTMVTLEAEHEMPADPIEMEEATEEGIEILHRRGPQRVLGKDGRVTALETIDVLSVFDEDGRFAPKFKEGSERQLEADTVIMAIGQEADLSFLGDHHRVELSSRKLIEVDRDTCATTQPGVYAGGDIAFGPRIAIEAVSDGKRAAVAIHEFMGGSAADSKEAVEIRPLGAARYQAGGGQLALARQNPATIPVARRIGPNEVECVYQEEMACQEGTRCLRCWVAPVFDSRRCILCGGCVDVCPELCLKLVPTERLRTDEKLTELLRQRYGDDDTGGTAIIKDETACIRCGLCAKRCPADAIAMVSFTCKGDRIDD